MSRGERALPWHKLNTGKQNLIIIGICVIIALVIMGVLGVVVNLK